MKIILMRLRITIAMLEIRNRETLQSKVNICKCDVKIGDYADSLSGDMPMLSDLQLVYMVPRNSTQLLKINTTKFQLEREPV